MNDKMADSGSTTASSSAAHEEQDVHNVFYLSYIVLLWSVIAVTAWQIGAIIDKIDLATQYCKVASGNETTPAASAVPAFAAQVGAADEQKGGMSSSCEYHSYAIFVTARAIELKHGIRELPITMAVAGFLLLSALRSFFGVHFAVSDPEWNQAQKSSFDKRGWNPEWPSQADVVFSGMHIALLGILAMAVKGHSAKSVAWLILAQIILTWIYNGFNFFAFCDRLKCDCSKHRFGLILMVDVAILVFSICLVCAVIGADGSWRYAFWVAVCTAILFFVEVALTYLPQILRSVRRTWRSVIYVVNPRNFRKSP